MLTVKVARWAAATLLAALVLTTASYGFKKNTSSLKFNTRQHKAGTVYRGQKVHGDFQFINVGKNPVKILGIHNPCGCTLKQSTVSNSYSPGQRGNLRVSFDTSHFRGSFHKEILLSVVAEKKQLLVPLRISAHVIEEITAKPPIIAFTPKEVAAQKIHWVTVDFKKLKNRRYTVDFDKRYFRITPGGTDRPDRFGVQVVARTAAGWRQKTILIKNASRHLPSLPVMVVYQMATGIKVTPEYLEFGAIDYRKSRRLDITVTGPNRGELTRSAVTVSINQNKEQDASKWAKAKILPGGKVAVTITNNLDRNGSLTGSVVLWAEKNPEIRYIIPIYAYLSR